MPQWASHSRSRLSSQLREISVAAGLCWCALQTDAHRFLDYREVAPGKATRNMYIGADGKLIPNENITGSVLGYRSVAVPGTVAGLELALKTYGALKLAEVMAPAIRLAKKDILSAKNSRTN